MPYTKTTNFTVKDALLSGNPAKVVKGAEIDVEFDNIAVNFNGIGPLGTAAAATLTTTSTDTTAGRVTKTGDAGWLVAGAGVGIVNMDSTTLASGSYVWAAADAPSGTRPTGSLTNGTVLVERFSGTIIKQTWTDINGGSAVAPRTWVRTSYLAATWGAWTEEFNAASTRLAYGVTPSAWGGAFSTIDLGLGFVLGNASNFSAFGTNLYNDGTNYRYKTAGSACILGMLGSLFNFSIAPSGTAGAVATLTNTLGVDFSGNAVQQNPAGTLGYGTGAGGTVTQATSKATGVTLNRPCGQITMNAASLAAGTAVSFTLTNSLISSTDNITMNIQSAATTGGSYLVQVDAVSAGSCRVSLRNLTAGALAEALILNFQINKAVTA